MKVSKVYIKSETDPLSCERIHVCIDIHTSIYVHLYLYRELKFTLIVMFWRVANQDSFTF